MLQKSEDPLQNLIQTGIRRDDRDQSSQSLAEIRLASAGIETPRSNFLAQQSGEQNQRPNANLKEELAA